ncbi:anthrax toxin lethal factor-related metalloendopeptidase, partial [Candidatus Phycosocius spiralis]|uniref:anthrax toxin lethal factor-related metalloendopeptidase n=1 Tax=Candidatus Phycosocius spiralis TaxID=2815099 RepID=UPI0024E1393E
IAVVVTAMAPFGGGIVGGALNAALGSVVSQAVGVATGIQEKFSWKGVALAAIGGAVGGALGKVAGLSGGATTAVRVAQSAIRSALGSAITQTIGVATGLQDKFSWAAVAAAGVGGGVGQFGAEKFTGGIKYNANGSVMEGSKTTFLNDTLSTGASLIASAASRSLVEGTDFGDNVIASLPDALGGLIGRRVSVGIGEGIRDAQQKEIERLRMEIKRVKDEAAPAPAAFDDGKLAKVVTTASGPPATASIGKITVTSINGGDPRVIVNELSNLPPEVLKNLERNKVKFVAAGDNVGEVISTGTPRGWPAGFKWSDVKAVYRSRTNTVIYATGPRLSTGSINTVLHETGHAIDFNNRNASSRAEFKAAWQSESASLKNYYHPTNGTNPNPTGYLQESYAESFANYFSKNTAYAKAHPAFNTYWGSRKW